MKISRNNMDSYNSNIIIAKDIQPDMREKKH